MDMHKTAFASDYDGTLCQSNWVTGEEHFDPAVLDAIRTFQVAGGRFGVCTGRPLFGTVEHLRGIVDVDFCIATTGAQIVDAAGNILSESTIDRMVARNLYERYASPQSGFIAVTADGLVSVGRDFTSLMRNVASLDDLVGDLYGVSLEFNEDEQAAHATAEELNKLFGSDVEGFQNLGSVDIVARGCSKGSGVGVVRKALGVECIAGIGDSYNDLPLLKAADVSYTFFASPAEVRDAATYVVDDLAAAIHHFMAL